MLGGSNPVPDFDLFCDRVGRVAAKSVGVSAGVSSLSAQTLNDENSLVSLVFILFKVPS